MTLNIVVIGTILALTVVIVYITRAWKGAEIEKASNAEMAKEAQERTQILERERLTQEALLRAQERDEEDDLPTADGGFPFYPRVPTDKDRLN